MIIKYDRFPHIVHGVRQEFLNLGRTVDRGEWQAMRDDRPQTQVFEINHVVFRLEVNNDPYYMAREIDPNLPWAEDHFQERISGKPLNPGEQYKNWPWYEQGVEEHKETGQFSHTYMERFWPQFAGNPDYPEINHGIRFQYGDLQTMIGLMVSRPYTRQAYLPIWFPEDLHASLNGERVPCTLGYHFIARPGELGPELDCTYFMRSCDYFRYLRDDVYMAARLLQHVASKTEMIPHHLTVHIANLHIFNNEVSRLRDEHEAEKARRLAGAF